MKYSFVIKNKHHDLFMVESVDGYQPSESDIHAFTQVLADKPVREYITDEVMVKYNFQSISELAHDILSLCAKRWDDREELRFLIRNFNLDIVGMIGADVFDKDKAELWYFKIASSPSCMHKVAERVLPILKKEKIRSLTTTVKPNNIPSLHILQKLGFHKTSKDNEWETRI